LPELSTMLLHLVCGLIATYTFATASGPGVPECSTRGLEEAFIQVSVSYDNRPQRNSPGEPPAADMGFGANLRVQEHVDSGNDGSVTSHLSWSPWRGHTASLTARCNSC
jgi:hypothetical protein